MDLIFLKTLKTRGDLYITNDIDIIIDKHLVRFIYNSINHSNKTSSNILRVKLLCVNSTFSSNFQYLSIKYGLTEATGTLILTIYSEKLEKMSILYPKPILCNVLKD